MHSVRPKHIRTPFGYLLSIRQCCTVCLIIGWHAVWAGFAISYYPDDSRRHAIDEYHQMIIRYQSELTDFELLSINASIVLNPQTGTPGTDLSPADAATWTDGVGPYPLSFNALSSTVASTSSTIDPALSSAEIGPRYEFALTKNWFPASLWDTYQQYNLFVRVTFADGTSTDVSAFDTAESAYGPLYPFRVVVRGADTIGCGTGKRCYEACTAIGGYWTYPECTIFYVMTGICLRIREVPGIFGFYAYDDSFGDSDDGGCGNWFDGRFSPITYEPTLYHPRTVYALNETARSISIRLGSDPLAYASFLTSGSMNFGPVVSPAALEVTIFSLIMCVLPALVVLVLFVLAKVARLPSAQRAIYVIGLDACLGCNSDAIADTTRGMHSNSISNSPSKPSKRIRTPNAATAATQTSPWIGAGGARVGVIRILDINTHDAMAGVTPSATATPTPPATTDGGTGPGPRTGSSTSSTGMETPEMSTFDLNSNSRPILAMATATATADTATPGVAPR